MPIEDVRVIKCDGTDCDKATTFNPQDPQQVAALPEWIKSVRMVNRGDKKNYAYCSDVCEVKGVTAGNHNVPEPPRVISAATEGEVKQAASNVAAAQALKQTDAGTEAAAKVSLT